MHLVVFLLGQISLPRQLQDHQNNDPTSHEIWWRHRSHSKYWSSQQQLLEMTKACLRDICQYSIVVLTPHMIQWLVIITLMQYCYSKLHINLREWLWDMQTVYRLICSALCLPRFLLPPLSLLATASSSSIGCSSCLFSDCMRMSLAQMSRTSNTGWSLQPDLALPTRVLHTLWTRATR